MATYFGQTVDGTEVGWDFGVWWSRNAAYVTGFNCPGSGVQVVKELSARVRRTSGIPNIRIAIYNSGGTLVGQGAAEVALAGTTVAWQGHLTQDDITPNPCNLTGGAQYYLGMALDAAAWRPYYTAGSLGDYHYDTDDYTGGWPSSMPSGIDDDWRYSLRCGVDPPAAEALPKSLHIFQAVNRAGTF